ncbi:glutamate receptor ionotropic, delta-2-like [Branchiostoma floridae x Branchiostoma belcheri]
MMTREANGFLSSTMASASLVPRITIFCMVMTSFPLKGISAVVEEVRIGAVFEEKNSEEENALRLAVEKINSDKNILPTVRVKYDFLYLTSQDTFSATKEGCNLLAGDPVAVISVTSCVNALSLQSVCAAFHVPHIHVPDERCDVISAQRFALSTSPHGREIDSALSDLIAQLKWRKVVFFYDDQGDFNRIQNILDRGQRGSLDVLILNFQRVQVSSGSFIDHVRDNDISLKNVVLLCRPSVIVDLVTEATKMGVISHSDHWIVVNEEITADDLHRMNVTRGIVTAIHREGRRGTNSSGTAEEHRSQLRSAYVYDAVTVIARSLDGLVKRESWDTPAGLTCDLGAPAPWDDGTAFLESLHQVDKGNILSERTSNESVARADATFQILQVKFTTNGTTMEQIGTWDPVNHLEMFQVPYPKDVGLQNVRLRVVTTEDIPFVFKSGEEDNPKFIGFSIDLLDELSKLLGFSYDIYEVADRKYGAPKPDGSWNGMIGDVVNMKAHLAISAMTITTQRETVVDFPKRYMDQSFGILTKKPEIKTNNVLGFLGPFSVYVWGCIVGALFTVGTVLFVLDRITPHLLYSEGGNETPGVKLKDSFWFIYSSLVQQGWDWSPQSFSCRLLSGFWWLFCLIIISTYTANLAAFLTVTRMETPIKSIDQLASQTVLPYGTVSDTSLTTTLQSSDIDVYQKMWRFMNGSDPPTFVETADEGFERVRQGNYAFLWDVAIIEHVALNDPTCSLMTSESHFYERGYGIALQQGSPYREDFSFGILQLQENGVLERLKDKWWPKLGKCSLSTSHTKTVATELGLDSFAGVFYVLMLGTLLSVSVCFVEILVYMRKGGDYDWKMFTCRKRGKPPRNETADTLVEIHRRENGNVQVTTTVEFPPRANTVPSSIISRDSRNNLNGPESFKCTTL